MSYNSVLFTLCAILIGNSCLAGDFDQYAKPNLRYQKSNSVMSNTVSKKIAQQQARHTQKHLLPKKHAIPNKQNHTTINQNMETLFLLTILANSN